MTAFWYNPRKRHYSKLHKFRLKNLKHMTFAEREMQKLLYQARDEVVEENNLPWFQVLTQYEIYSLDGAPYLLDFYVPRLQLMLRS